MSSHLPEEFQPAPESGNKNAWMLTFADLLSLVLTFFVMLYSISVIEGSQFSEMSRSLGQRLNPDNVSPDYSAELTISLKKDVIAEDLDYLYAVVSEKAERAASLKQLGLVREDDRLVISLPSDALFAPNSATLSPESAATMEAVGTVIGQLPNKIEVYGHTDPAPIQSKDFPSNWELSLSRAVTVANGLRAQGYRYKIVSMGLADARYDELPVSLPQPERYKLARRVDVIIRHTIAEE